MSSPDESTSLLPGEDMDIDIVEQEERKRTQRVVCFGISCVFMGILLCANPFPNWFHSPFSSDDRGYEKRKNITPNDPPAAFPENFVFGSATSSYQVEGAVHEGGRGLTVWDTFCYEGGHVLNNNTGDVACDHYHLYESDIKMMKDLNLQAYRFSIAWSRILPTGYGGEPNQAGIEFYNRLIDRLIDSNIQPWITLFHWDLPQQLQDDVGGWLDTSRDNTVVTAFGDYARICFQEFGDRVKHWITLNEPWTVAVHGYNDGIKAPGHHHDGAHETYIVAHNQLLAHAEAAQIYKKEFSAQQKGMIGFSNSADYRYPLSDTQDDIDAAERAMLFQFGWFIEPVLTGEYPSVMRERLGDRLPQFTKRESERLKDSCDFLGINTYSSALASQPDHESPWGGYWADMFVDTHIDPSWEKNFMGWPIVPDATRELLLWISQRYGNPLLYITENGTAEDEENVETAKHDEVRRRFFEGHLRACAEAIDSGVNLAGYFAWSLMDNFEWEYGYQRRFGICFVDWKTQVRTPKSSALWYRKTIATRGKNIPRR
jgi:beta-galactosidase